LNFLGLDKVAATPSDLQAVVTASDANPRSPTCYQTKRQLRSEQSWQSEIVDITASEEMNTTLSKNFARSAGIVVPIAANLTSRPFAARHWDTNLEINTLSFY